MFSFVIKMFDNFIRDPSANKGSEIVSAIYGMCDMLPTVKMAHAQFKPNPASLESRKTGSRGVFDYKHVGFMDSSFGVSHSLFFMPITNLNLHEYVFIGESALNLNM